MAERKIGNHTYRTEPLNAVASLKLLTRLTKILGPALRHLNAAFDADEGKRDAAALAAFGSVIESVDPEEFQSLIIETASMASIQANGAYEPVVFDFHFTGNLLEAFQVVLFVLEVNFKGFFDGAKASPLARRVMASPQSSSPA